MVFSHFFEDLFTLLDGQALGRTLLDTHHVVEAQVCNKKRLGFSFLSLAPYGRGGQPTYYSRQIHVVHLSVRPCIAFMASST